MQRDGAHMLHFAGMDEGVARMTLGQKATLHIPACEGYGEAGAGVDIPPNSDLEFEVELRAVHRRATEITLHARARARSWPA